MCTLRIGPPARYAGGYHSTTAKIRSGRSVGRSLQAMAFKVLSEHDQRPHAAPRPLGFSGHERAFHGRNSVGLHPSAVLKALQAPFAHGLQLASHPRLPRQDEPHLGTVHHVVGQQAVERLDQQAFGRGGKLVTVWRGKPPPQGGGRGTVYAPRAHAPY